MPQGHEALCAVSELESRVSCRGATRLAMSVDHWAHLLGSRGKRAEHDGACSQDFQSSSTIALPISLFTAQVLCVPAWHFVLAFCVCVCVMLLGFGVRLVT